MTEHERVKQIIHDGLFWCNSLDVIAQKVIDAMTPLTTQELYQRWLKGVEARASRD